MSEPKENTTTDTGAIGPFSEEQLANARKVYDGLSAIFAARKETPETGSMAGVMVNE